MAALARHDAKANHTPRRSIRIGEVLWRQAQAKAEANGETITSVIVRSLERYVKRG